ncbi:hypothetical protein LPTSP4_19470 [Leptospira ryugenii]|uniref:Uncharacterized protein n=1 Tax=Leptospira ryugenii TaxID=1917863 RepID=A0A2P2E0M9_9LEPT|nr:hypothetical protein LPTSP4_19470 [Leptospira ryugenii]
MVAAETWMEIWVVLEPKAFDAVIVCNVDDCVEVGVPEMTQVVLLIESPVGRFGFALHDVGLFPVKVGDKLAMAFPCVYTNGEPA